jgi:hypothetical protein
MRSGYVERAGWQISDIRVWTEEQICRECGYVERAGWQISGRILSLAVFSFLFVCSNLYLNYIIVMTLIQGAVEK